MSINPHSRQLEMPPLQRMTLTSPRGSATEEHSTSLLVALGATGRRPSPGVISPGIMGSPSPVVGASPTRKIGKLKRRETTGRLLDLAKPVVAQGMMKSPVGSASLPEPLMQAQASSSPRSASWKSSKLFSRTMTSGDLLKGVKKPAPASAEEEQTSSSSSSSSSFKGSFRNRLSSLRRKPSGSEVIIKVESEETSPPRGRKCSSSDEARGPPTTPPRKKSEDEGIVCKKEDLISLIRKAAKKQAALNKAEAAAAAAAAAAPQRLSLRITRSTSLERTQDDQTGASDSTGTCGQAIKEPSPKSSFEKNLSPQLKSPMARSPVAKTCPVTFDIIPPPPEEEEDVAKVDISVPKTVEEEEEEEDIQVEDKDIKRKSSNVEWDDNSIVDAMLLGGAIEAFLKGSMGGSEKRVSFKKN